MVERIERLKAERKLILTIIGGLSGELKKHSHDELRNLDFEIAVLAGRNTRTTVAGSPKKDILAKSVHL